MENETLAERLVCAREKSGLTAQQLSEKCGVSTELYDQWESGASEPDTETARVLAEVLGISSDMLLFGLENRHGIQTMFPKGAEPAPVKGPMSDWRFILGLVLIFLGIACIAMMLVSAQTNGYYDTVSSLIKSCLKSPSPYVFCAMIVGGITLCIVAGVQGIKRVTENKKENKKDSM